jgi:hypothetical protein
VRQKQWKCFADGNEEAVMVALCGWYDGDGREVMEQELVLSVMQLRAREHALEIQTTFRRPDGGEDIQLGKTNFGFLAVRVAKTLSVHFGGGTLTDSEGRQGEPEIFGQSARWVDYSGPVAVGERSQRSLSTNGITYFDHPQNPRYPTHWHVRADGWMGASFCMNQPWLISESRPLTLRYLLHAHRGPYDADTAIRIHNQFAERPGFTVSKSSRPHLHYEVTRESPSGRTVAEQAGF